MRRSGCYVWLHIVTFNYNIHSRIYAMNGKDILISKLIPRIKEEIVTNSVKTVGDQELLQYISDFIILNMFKVAITKVIISIPE